MHLPLPLIDRWETTLKGKPQACLFYSEKQKGGESVWEVRKRGTGRNRGREDCNQDAFVKKNLSSIKQNNES